MTAVDSRPNQHPVRDIVDRLDALGGSGTLTVREVIEAFGRAGFLPVMIVPALLVVSPLSGIPLFSSLCGLSIALIAVQLLLRRERIWLPDIIMRRRIEGARIHTAAKWLGRVADWIDRHARDRLRVLTDPPLNVVPRVFCVLCGLAMPFLELVPFSSSLLGGAVTLIAAGFLSRDGLYILGAFCIVALAACVPLAVAGGLVG